MKKVFKILLALLVLIGMMGCSNTIQPDGNVTPPIENGGGGNIDSNNPMLSKTPLMQNISIDNLCSSKVSIQFVEDFTPRAFSTIVEGKVPTLTYFDGKTNKPYIFKTPEGVNVLLGVTELYKLDENIIGIKYDSIYPIYSGSDFDKGNYVIANDNHHYFRQAIVYLNENKLIPINQYDFHGMKAHGGKVYCHGKQLFHSRLYEIDSKGGRKLLNPYATPGNVFEGCTAISPNNESFYIFDATEGNKHIIALRDRRGDSVNSMGLKICDLKNKFIYFNEENHEDSNNPIIASKLADNIVCFIQKKENEPIYVLYQINYQTPVKNDLIIGEIDRSELKNGKLKLISRKESLCTLTLTTPFSLSDPTEVIIEDKHTFTNYKYPCFYSKVSGTEKYIQNTTRYHQTEKLRIIDYQNGQVVEVDISNKDPILNKRTESLNISIPWKNYGNANTRETFRGEKYFDDPIEMVGDYVYFAEGDNIKKANIFVVGNDSTNKTLNEGKPANNSEFSVMGDNIVFSSGNNTYNIPLEGETSTVKSFSQFDIGVKDAVNFKTIQIVQPKFENTTISPEREKELEGLFKKLSWRAIFENKEDFTNENTGEPIPTFTITDLDKNMMTLELDKNPYNPGSIELNGYNSIGHYEVREDTYEGKKVPRLDLLVSEDCLMFSLLYLGKSNESLKVLKKANINGTDYDLDKSGYENGDEYIIVRLLFEELTLNYKMKVVTQ